MSKQQHVGFYTGMTQVKLQNKGVGAGFQASCIHWKPWSNISLLSLPVGRFLFFFRYFHYLNGHLPGDFAQPSRILILGRPWTIYYHGMGPWVHGPIWLIIRVWVMYMYRIICTLSSTRHWGGDEAQPRPNRVPTNSGSIVVSIQGPVTGGFVGSFWNRSAVRGSQSAFLDVHGLTRTHTQTPTRTQTLHVFKMPDSNGQDLRVLSRPSCVNIWHGATAAPSSLPTKRSWRMLLWWPWFHCPSCSLLRKLWR